LARCIDVRRATLLAAETQNERRISCLGAILPTLAGIAIAVGDLRLSACVKLADIAA
jgi:hypothetical protein